MEARIPRISRNGVAEIGTPAREFDMQTLVTSLVALFVVSTSLAAAASTGWGKNWKVRAFKGN